MLLIKLPELCHSQELFLSPNTEVPEKKNSALNEKHETRIRKKTM
jgi:hypothetical protein